MVKRRGPGDWDPFDGWPFSFDPAGMMDEMMRMMGGGEGVTSHSYGYRMTVGPDGERKIEVFGDPPDGLLPAGGKVVDEALLPGAAGGGDSPITDVMECGGTIVVTVEMPGLDGEDIELTVDEKKIRIDGTNGQREYHAEIDLPGQVVPESVRKTFVNGIFEMTLERADKCSGDKHI
jgi:HSP20 family protein